MFSGIPDLKVFPAIPDLPEQNGGLRVRNVFKIEFGISRINDSGATILLRMKCGREASIVALASLFRCAIFDVLRAGLIA